VHRPLGWKAGPVPGSWSMPDELAFELMREGHPAARGSFPAYDLVGELIWLPTEAESREALVEYREWRARTARAVATMDSLARYADSAEAGRRVAEQLRLMDG